MDTKVMALSTEMTSLSNEELISVNGGVDWWGLVSDMSTILGIEAGTCNVILGVISVTNPWLLPIMGAVGVTAGAAWIWRAYEDIYN